jgi:hypothetical protein
MYIGASAHGSLPRVAIASVTAGFKCAPLKEAVQ